MTSLNTKIKTLLAANVANVANMNAGEIDASFDRLKIQGALSPMPTPDVMTAPATATVPAPVIRSTVALDIESIAGQLMTGGQVGLEKAIQQAIDINVQTAQKNASREQEALTERYDALVTRSQMESENAASALKSANEAISTAPAKDNYITRTVRVNAKGAEIAPDVDVKFVEYAPAFKLWPELPKSADYLFPVCDYTLESPQFYNMTAVHDSGALAFMALCNKVSDRKLQVWLHGESGTGKSSLLENIAKTTARPFINISCDGSTVPEALVGQFLIPDGKSSWSDGAFLKGIRTPYALINFDELDKAPQIANWLQGILSAGYVTISETGEVVYLAEGVTIAATGNTSGNGDSTNRFDDTAVLNTALKERFAYDLHIDYMDEATEIDALTRAIGCSKKISHACVDIAQRIRQSNDIEQPISFRRLLALATALQAGIPVYHAIEASVYTHVRNDTDQESYRALFTAHFPSQFRV